MATAITLDKQRQISFPISALKRIEAQTGTAILAGIQAPSISFISACLLHGLLEEDPTLTPEDVDTILGDEMRGGKNLIQIWAIVCEEFKAIGIVGGSKVKPRGNAKATADNPTVAKA